MFDASDFTSTRGYVPAHKLQLTQVQFDWPVACRSWPGFDKWLIAHTNSSLHPITFLERSENFPMRSGLGLGLEVAFTAKPM